MKDKKGVWTDMTIQIRYYTRSGNTKKLAEAIEKAIGVEAQTVEHDLNEKCDVLFLGCSYYAFDIDEHIKQFLKRNKDKIGRIACFGSSAMMKSVKKPVRKAIDTEGICVTGEEFHTKGAFGPLNKGRPDENDLAQAMEFAKRIAKG